MLNRIIKFCSDKYEVSDNICSYCKNTCHGSCKRCLEKINFKKEVIREYNCKNIVCYYTCHHLYRYASEIEYALEKFDHSVLKNLNILSIGCGPSTELYGIVNYFLTHGHRNITYHGIDQNRIWNKIQEKNKEIFEEVYKNININYINTDAFDYINTIDIKPNVLILNYFISDMLLHGNNMYSFVDKVYMNLITEMPENSILILNDINLGKDDTHPRFYFELLRDRLKSDNFTKTCARFHFKNNNRPFFNYGFLHTNNCIKYKVMPGIENLFEPWEFCASAQLLVRLK